MLRRQVPWLAGAGPAKDSAAGVTRRLSGMQKEVLALYRQLWRAAGRKTDPAVCASIRAHIRAEFDTHRQIPRRSVDAIEWRLRNGRQQLELLQKSKPTDGFGMLR